MFIADTIKTLERLTLTPLTNLYVILSGYFHSFSLFFLKFDETLVLFQQSSILILEYKFIILSFLSSCKNTCLRADVCYKNWKSRADGERGLII